MDKPNILILAVFLIFLVVQPGTNSQWVPRPIAHRPLCASEVAIANHACAFLPYDPGHLHSPPPPSPPSLSQRNDSNEHELVHEHERRHRHKHGHNHRRHKHRATPLEQQCCRWLETMDRECVCSLLVHLPAFLSRPVHQYTVVVKDSCNVTYNCGSRITT